MAIKPQILLLGDTIGVVTLGSPLARSIIDTGIQMLTTMGYRVLLGRHVYDADGYLAGTDQERAEDFMDMILNPEVKLILPVRGGVGVAGILPYLDFHLISQNPKIISGFSDITVLLNAVYQFANLISLQSLLLLNFNSTEPQYNFNQFFTAVSSATSSREIINPPGKLLLGKVAGNVTGAIVGGNLTSFVDMLGTPYDIDTAGKILMIEETHEPINTVYRYINHLKLAGKFDDCLGIIMGECTNCVIAYGQTYEDLINNVMVPLGKPLLTNLSTAHGLYKAAIPIGAIANLNTTKATLTIVENTVIS